MESARLTGIPQANYTASRSWLRIKSITLKPGYRSPLSREDNFVISRPVGNSESVDSRHKGAHIRPQVSLTRLRTRAFGVCVRNCDRNFVSLLRLQFQGTLIKAEAMDGRRNALESGELRITRSLILDQIQRWIRFSSCPGF